MEDIKNYAPLTPPTPTNNNYDLAPSQSVVMNLTSPFLRSKYPISEITPGKTTPKLLFGVDTILSNTPKSASPPNA